jgi:ATP-binding cassette subfamily C (CFTR/MRP) protein 4
MFESVVRSPALYFDRTPTGRIINRFSNDIGVMDLVLATTAMDAIELTCYFFNLIITICVINPWIIIPAFVELIMLVSFFKWYKPILLQVKQQDLVNKSPVYSHFASLLAGQTQIRVY